MWVFMERSLATVWAFLLGAGLTLAFSVATTKNVPQSLQLLGCVFIPRSNVTCHWTPGDNQATYYTLKAEKMLRSKNLTFSCTTTGLSCTAGINGSGLRFTFCISVISHSISGNVSSKIRCQSARIEGKLAPVSLNSVRQVDGSPHCLSVSWTSNVTHFPLAPFEIERGELNSQIKFTAEGEVNAQVRNVSVTGYTFQVCLFKPYTSYTLEIRNRYLGEASPWSEWSNPFQGRTAEAAPSAAPALWREVGPIGRNGWRLISLLWKPLPRFMANGRVTFYNVTCRAENGLTLSDYGSCGKLQPETTSCSLPLPAGRCSCSLTASTSAGTSPKALVWISGSSEKEPPPPAELTATPLGDDSVKIRWRPPPDLSVSGFVVEWVAVREETSSVLHWEKLNSSSTKLIITEGVKTMERYAISVKALYGEQGAGGNITLHVYTQEGTPSAGPDVRVEHISETSVELSWSPVPVEQLHGFIRSYALVCTTRNQLARSVTVPGDLHRYTLENMSPGIYDIFIRASTVAGTGPAGNPANVHIGSEEISIVICIIVPLLLMSLVSILILLLAQMRVIKKKLFHRVPDPSNSTVSQWNPTTSFENKKLIMEQEKPEVSFPEVIGRRDPEWAHSYLPICKAQLCLDPQLSSFPARASDRGYITNMTKTQSADDLSIRPCSYSTVLYNQCNQNPPSSPQAGQKADIRHNDSNQPADGVSESSVFRFTESEEQKAFAVFLERLKSLQSSSPDFSGTPPSCVSLPHQTDSPRLNATLSAYRKLPSDSFASTFPSLAFMDLSSSPVEFGPYISSDRYIKI
ncbi:PREDICTED: interleukin-6 receptor subunit beta-like [Poecilia mexicana]|uniref:Interleukin-6 receptor subunit beta-like n=2 Tax=Poecilia TaxID=8080 RepID=A0A096LZQ7_POEFO|nr:PREDICTED: interleukin-6 receptor subunit beta-like [Poecilia formosa]XP_014850985.1 PREDICTED: interleukin-6 receptor subunit beta-like [Poecilia mexicana]